MVSVDMWVPVGSVGPSVVLDLNLLPCYFILVAGAGLPEVANNCQLSSSAYDSSAIRYALRQVATQADPLVWSHQVTLLFRIIITSRSSRLLAKAKLLFHLLFSEPFIHHERQSTATVSAMSLENSSLSLRRRVICFCRRYWLQGQMRSSFPARISDARTTWSDLQRRNHRQQQNMGPNPTIHPSTVRLSSTQATSDPLDTTPRRITNPSGAFVIHLVGTTRE